MNEFNYSTLPKDVPKTGVSNPLYSSSLDRSTSNMINKSNSFSLPAQEYEHFRSNSLPSGSFGVSNPNSNLNASSSPTNTISCDLQEVIFCYQSQPELLKLILLSKVEEDKRKAEEAKLRAKELDMFLIQQQQQGTPQTPDAMNSSASTPSNSLNQKMSSINQNSSSLHQNPNALNISPNNMNASSNNLHSPTNTLNMPTNYLNGNQFNTPRRLSVLEMLMPDSNPDRRDSALGSSFDESTHADELDHKSFSSNSNPSMLSMSFPTQPIMSAPSSNRNTHHPLSPPYSINQNEDTHSFTSQLKFESPSRRPEPCFLQRPRRRREMQAISKIVETRDYPYVDGFFWKNNGNTVQKKTGNKSVYYKCSNSSKGCPVNKTVTWKDNGQYLIKYRGDHLADCGKVQRIIDM